jgi:hypothetical protein
VSKRPRTRIRIRIKEFKFFKPKKYFSALGNMIRDVHPGFGIFIPDPGAKKVQKASGRLISTKQQANSRVY